MGLSKALRSGGIQLQGLVEGNSQEEEEESSVSLHLLREDLDLTTRICRGNLQIPLSSNTVVVRRKNWNPHLEVGCESPSLK